MSITSNARRGIRATLILVSAVVTTSCQGSLEAGDRLSGRWINANASLAANSDSVVFQEPCARAVFPPLVLDANRGFSADSKSFLITGNIFQLPGEQLHISGTFVGDNITLTIYTIGGPGGGDPVVITLTPGRTLPGLLCTA